MSGPGGAWSRGCVPGLGGCLVGGPGPGRVPGGHPPPGRLLLRAVHILLECILVKNVKGVRSFSVFQTTVVRPSMITKLNF